jgi:hypothetical protein
VGAPQLKQNLAPAGNSVPQLPHTKASAVPQLKQKRAPSGFCVAQLGQSISKPPLFWAWPAAESRPGENYFNKRVTLFRDVDLD